MVALKIVAKVVFKGLMGRADLNGLDGTVVSSQPSTKRFKLRSHKLRPHKLRSHKLRSHKLRSRVVSAQYKAIQVKGCFH